MPDNNLELDRQNAALTRQLLEWIAEKPRSYREALDVWKSTCPRHTIWEDAMEQGLIECGADRDGVLALTELGRNRLDDSA